MHNEIFKKAQELDALFCNNAQIREIELFFRENEEELIKIFDKTICCCCLFSPVFIKGIESRYVKKICQFLQYSRLHDQSFYVAAIVMNNRIEIDKKALFANVLLFDSRRHYTIFPEMRICGEYLDPQNKQEEVKKEFMKNTNASTKDYKTRNKQLSEAIKNDHVSVFEITRQLKGLRITLTLLLNLLNYDAKKCFLYLLANFREQVYRCRTATEWLFTMCRVFDSDIAVPVIKQIEMDNPGLVANARDPWGNTLLWNTLVNQNDSVGEIQNTLIRLGCDQNTRNPWGLSFRLIKENPL